MRNSLSAQIFLNKLNWKANTGEISSLREFRVDVYRFIFKVPLEGECLRGFTEYLQNLNMSELRSILKIWLWLYQHNARFQMVYSYNKGLTFRHNMKSIMNPLKVRRALKRYKHDDLMSCPL